MTISVVVPNYNCARYLTEAIDSVLAQTLGSLEVIVIDDGSSDDSRDIVDRYPQPVRLIALPHTGKPGLVRNAGIRAAKGSLIAFIDADDMWMPTKLARQVEYLRAHPDVAMVHSNLHVVDAAGSYLRDIFLGCPGSQGLSDDYGTSSFLQLVNGDSNVWTSSVMIRRECLDEVGGFEEDLTVGEDYHLWIRIARRHRIGYLSEPLAKHRKHGKNTGTSWAQLFPPQEVLLWRHIVRMFPDIAVNHKHVIHAKSLFHYVVACLRCARQGRYLTAARLLLVGTAIHLPRTRWRDLRRIGAKYLRIRRLQRQTLLAAGAGR